MATLEYRKLLRANVALRVLYKSLSAPPLEGMGYSRNVGTIGVNIIMAEKIERNSDVELKIFLPNDDKPVNARGKVIWLYSCEYIPASGKQYYACGVQFDTMSTGDAIKASDFVRNLLKERSTQELKKIIDKIEEEK